MPYFLPRIQRRSRGFIGRKWVIWPAERGWILVKMVDNGKSVVHFFKVIFHIRKEKISGVYIYVCARIYIHTYPLTHHGMDCHFYLKKEEKNGENVSLRFIPSLFCTKLPTLSHFWIGDGRLSWFSVSDHFYTSFFVQNPRVKSQSI